MFRSYRKTFVRRLPRKKALGFLSSTNKKEPGAFAPARRTQTMLGHANKNIMLKLGIISDTHGCVSETAVAVKLFRDRGVQTVIHCGDIGDTAVVKTFQRLETHFVLGNMDKDEESLRTAIEETGNHFHGQFGSIEKSGKRIAFLHGDNVERFERELESGNWDLLCYGHTHMAECQMRNSTLRLNPGAFVRVPRPTVAIVTLPDLTVEMFDLT